MRKQRWVVVVVVVAVVAGAAGCQQERAIPVECGDGTALVGGRCVAPRCGPGTFERDGECTPACGPGTTLADDDTCVPTLECGEGTHASGNDCVADGDLACGPGTHASGIDCVPDGGGVVTPSYDVRIPETVQAMDFPVAIFAFGRNDDGTPVVDVPIRFQIDRLSAGDIPDPTHTLGLFGTSTTFIPCLASDADCLGPARLELVVDNTVVASAPFEVVPPDGVGDPSLCLGGGNALYMNGPQGDWVHPFEDLITDGNFTAQSSSGFVGIHVDPADPNAHGLWWDADFAAPSSGPLAESVYPNATRYPFNNSGPGLDVTGDGRGCNQSSGTFQIEELDVSNNTVHAFTATWLQSCDGGPSMAGCVHFEQ